MSKKSDPFLPGIGPRRRKGLGGRLARQVCKKESSFQKRAANEGTSREGAKAGTKKRPGGKRRESRQRTEHPTERIIGRVSFRILEESARVKTLRRC